MTLVLTRAVIHAVAPGTLGVVAVRGGQLLCHWQPAKGGKWKPNLNQKDIPIWLMKHTYAMDLYKQKNQ